MESVFGLPDAALTVADPERDAVVREMPIELGYDDAEPEAEDDFLNISEYSRLENR